MVCCRRLSSSDNMLVADLSSKAWGVCPMRCVDAVLTSKKMKMTKNLNTKIEIRKFDFKSEDVIHETTATTQPTHANICIIFIPIS